MHNKSKLASAIMLCSILVFRFDCAPRTYSSHLIGSSAQRHPSTTATSQRRPSPGASYAMSPSKRPRVPPHLCLPSFARTLHLPPSTRCASGRRLHTPLPLVYLGPPPPKNSRPATPPRALQKLLYTKPPCPSRASTTGLTPTSRRRRSDVKQFLSPPK